MQTLQQFFTRLKWFVGFYVLLMLGVAFFSILGSAGDIAARSWSEWNRPTAQAQIVSVEELCRVSANRNLIPHDGPRVSLIPCHETAHGVRVASRNDRVTIAFEAERGRRIEAVVPRRELGLSLDAKAGDTLRVSYDRNPAAPRPRAARTEAENLIVAGFALPLLVALVFVVRIVRWIFAAWVKSTPTIKTPAPTGKDSLEALAAAIQQRLAGLGRSTGTNASPRAPVPPARPSPVIPGPRSAHGQPPSQRAPTVRRASWWG